MELVEVGGILLDDVENLMAMTEFNVLYVRTTFPSKYEILNNLKCPRFLVTRWDFLEWGKQI